MKFLRSLLLSAALIFPISAPLQATPINNPVASPFAAEQVGAFTLQFKPGHQLSAEYLSGMAGVGLVLEGKTRTGALVLKVSGQADAAAGQQILARLRLLPEVLWAERVPTVSASAGFRASMPDARPKSASRQFTLKLRNQDALPPDLLAQLGRMAGEELVYIRAMSGGNHLLGVRRELSASEMSVLMERLEALAEVLYADPVVSAKSSVTPNDTYYASQWNLFETTGGALFPAAWDISTGSTSAVVAVIDSGILPHPDLTGKVLPGYDMVADTTQANDGNGRDSDPTDPGDWAAANECGSGEAATNSTWHGTHVAGIIGAATSNATGVAGAGWNTMILPVRTGGKCGILSSDVLDSIRWAVGLPVPAAPVNPTPAKVLNLSLGGDGACFSSLQAAINDALATGAVVVVSAGNETMNVLNSWPANCSGVIAVAANDRSGDAASYTNYGSLIKISAPGGDGYGGGILSTMNSGTTTASAYNYKTKIGTSMAAPHVSAAAALMLAVNPGLSASQVLSILQSSARLFAVGTQCANYPGYCGSGMLNAGAAVATASGQITPQTGWWWNPSQNGRGFMIEKRGGNLFMASYLYETDGRASWYASGGAMGASSYQGVLSAYGGGQTLTGAYVPPVSLGSAGSISLQLTSATSGTLTWPGGTIPVERFNIVANGINAAPAAFQPESGWWWNSAESGRGFGLEIQGGTLFMAGYMYDTQGNPIWYSSSGAMTTSSSYTGAWVQWANGQSLSGSYKAPIIANANVGNVSLQFTSTTSAIMTLPDNRQIALTRFLF